MDCNMPVMDGYRASQEITNLCTQHHLEVPYIVALTAHVSSKEIDDRCKQHGMRECFNKPIDANSLEKLMKKL
jgi:CheY-like chemotaxis protein